MEQISVSDDINWWHDVEERAFLLGDQITMHIAGEKLDEIVTDEALVQMEGEQ